MKLRRPQFSILLAMIAVTAIALAFAAPDKAASGVTAKELAGSLAAAARATNAHTLAGLLLHVDLGTRPEAPLSEAGAVAILKRVGFAATNSTPDRLLTEECASPWCGPLLRR